MSKPKHSQNFQTAIGVVDEARCYRGYVIVKGNSEEAICTVAPSIEELERYFADDSTIDVSRAQEVYMFSAKDVEVQS